MHHNIPKTPARSRTRSEAKTPLTPSVLSGLSNLSLASTPAKRQGARTKTRSVSSVYDTTNPFIAPPSFAQQSRPSSPIKRTTSSGIPLSEAFKRQANGGVIRKGGVESRLEVVTRDYVPPPKPEIKRSKSTPAVVGNSASLKSVLTLLSRIGWAQTNAIGSSLIAIRLRPTLIYIPSLPHSSIYLIPHRHLQRQAPRITLQATRLDLPQQRGFL